VGKFINSSVSSGNLTLLTNWFLNN
jgi:hypothetical protein